MVVTGVVVDMETVAAVVATAEEVAMGVEAAGVEAAAVVAMVATGGEMNVAMAAAVRLWLWDAVWLLCGCSPSLARMFPDQLFLVSFCAVIRSA